MAEAKKAEERTLIREGREGSRWINHRPDGKDVAEWFEESVSMHEGMDSSRYVGGIVLIEQTLKINEITGVDQNGMALTREMKHTAYTPYAKVESRIQYFWDYMMLHEDWIGEIVPVEQHYEGVGLDKRPPLPPGFFKYVAKQDNRETAFVGCTMRVEIYRRNEDGTRNYQAPVAVFPPATKIVPVLDRSQADEFALMKAETGAIGRALGMAGMLVINGSGISTAEDMLELRDQQAGTTAIQAPEVTPPPVVEEVKVDRVGELRQRVIKEMAELQKLAGEKATSHYADFGIWWRGRDFKKISEIEENDLKAISRKAQQMIEEVKLTSAAPD